jgi:hypothetical protein
LLTIPLPEAAYFLLRKWWCDVTETERKLALWVPALMKIAMTNMAIMFYFLTSITFTSPYAQHISARATSYKSFG